MNLYKVNLVVRGSGQSIQEVFVTQLPACDFLKKLGTYLDGKDLLMLKSIEVSFSAELE